jgi:S-adenosyl methyltransferase
MPGQATNLVRLYDAMLGGKDNYEVDRAARDRLSAIAPGFPEMSRNNHQFLLRATRFLAGEAGIRQFLDCGAALPSSENMHEVVQRLNTEASVVYLTADELTLAHGRALLAENDQTHIVAADFRDVRDVLGNPTVRKYIDFDEPVAICLAGTMNYILDQWDPWGIMAELIAASAPNSYFVFAQLLHPGPDHEFAGMISRVEEAYHDARLLPIQFRPAERITAMLAGLDLVEPGRLIPVADWWPDGPRYRPLTPIQQLLIGGIGRKP